MYIKKEEVLVSLRDENRKLERRVANLRNELKIYQNLVEEMDIPLLGKTDAPAETTANFKVFNPHLAVY